MSQEIKIIINKDGTIEIDQIGWEGSSCSGSIDDFIEALGSKKSVKKKSTFYHKHMTKKQKKQNIQENRR
jgi:hypothetical protein